MRSQLPTTTQGLIKPDAHAPTLAEFRAAVAEAALRTLRKSLTDAGREAFHHEMESAPTIADVLTVAQRWIATVEFVSLPDAKGRLERSEKAHRDRVKGETPKQLFARLGL